jgi:hypothetical protein
VIASLLVPRALEREYAAFAAGLAAAGYQVVGAVPNPDISVIWGGAPPKRMPGGVVLVAENGYWSGPGGPYVALGVVGGNVSAYSRQRGHERLQQLGIAIQPWQQDGKHVLVCPSRGIGLNPQPAGWTERTVEILRRHTDRPVRVRPHPGNWKTLPEHPDVGLARDLAGAWACCIWASSAGIRALVAGVPVFQCAPHWICTAAASLNLAMIEDPAMDEDRRVSALEKMAAAQWSLDEIGSGEAIRSLVPEAAAGAA